MELEKNTAEFAALGVAAYSDVIDDIIDLVRKCIKCSFWSCRISC
jgi:hypothetical protein